MAEVRADVTGVVTEDRGLFQHWDGSTPLLSSSTFSGSPWPLGQGFRHRHRILTWTAWVLTRPPGAHLMQTGLNRPTEIIQNLQGSQGNVKSLCYSLTAMPFPGAKFQHAFKILTGSLLLG